MDGVGVAFLASGLAVDSCFVSLAQGLASRNHRWSEALKLGVTFGVMQGGMALAGWFAGESVARLVASVDHWIAFGLLAAIGVKTILEARSDEHDEERGVLSKTKLLVAGIATSIDALAAGFGLSLIREGIAATAIAATLITGFGSVLAYYGGRRVGAHWERRGHVIAGLVLIGIGVHILFEHRDHLF